MGVENKRNGGSIPQSVRQKRILDMAADHPDASMETIANGVSSATVNDVADVLDEYGDPGRAVDDKSEPEEPGSDAEDVVADPSSLSDEQRETLVAIRQQPDATQKEIAETLDVARATVSNRVNGINGFEWDDRFAIASAVLDGAGSEEGGDREVTASGAAALEASVKRLSSRIDDLERRFDEVDGTAEVEGTLDDPELVHKVMHACLESDGITETEELEILRSVLR